MSTDIAVPAGLVPVLVTVQGTPVKTLRARCHGVAVGIGNGLLGLRIRTR